MTSPATTDLCDAHPETQVCDPVFQTFGGERRFSGPITTLKVFEDNTLIQQAVESPGEGRVLVVDGGGSLRCGAGRRQPRRARPRTNGWAGIVVYGCVRDADELDAAADRRPRPGGLPAQERARACTPVRPAVPVVFAGVIFREGEWLCADRDGVVVLPEAPVEPSDGGGAGGRGGGVRPAVSSAAGQPARARPRASRVPLVQPGADVVGRVGAALALVAGQHGTHRRRLRRGRPVRAASRGARSVT